MLEEAERLMEEFTKKTLVMLRIYKPVINIVSNPVIQEIYENTGNLKNFLKRRREKGVYGASSNRA